MRNFLSFALRKNHLPSIKLLWKAQSFFTSKYKETVWVDTDGNTLCHYYAMHHNLELFQFANDKPKNLKILNNKGKAPIHIFVERSFFHKEIPSKEKHLNCLSALFYQIFSFLKILHLLPNFLKKALKKEKNNEPIISIHYNEVLLQEMIKEGADINQFMEFPERKALGWGTSDFGAFSIKDIVGSPIELLVYLFWRFTLFPSFKDENEVVKIYEDYFHFLTSLGANINLIVQGNTNDIHITDAMESFPSRIVSSFFCKFISNNKDFYAIKPILSDSTIDFSITDDMGNTVLHTLFARISARHERLSEAICEKIVLTIAQNPNITSEVLSQKNNFNMSPIELLRWGEEHLRKHLESVTLKKDLDCLLKKKSGEKKSIQKV